MQGKCINMLKAVFFDMDGVLLNSMPVHAEAWVEVMNRHGLAFTPRDAFLNEGRTGRDVIREAILQYEHRDAEADELEAIYREKNEAFKHRPEPGPVEGVQQVLQVLGEMGIERWIVTGSGLLDLKERLEKYFPGIFTPERMITAYDVTHGKPHAEPYLKAWERCGYHKDECIVVENAPLGVRSGKAAELFTIAVNTGPLTEDDLLQAGADIVMDNMYELNNWIQEYGKRRD